MGSGGASWVVATWRVLVDGINAHTWGIFGFPAGFQFLWASLAFKTSLNTFSLFAETHLVISEKLSSQTL